MEDIEAERNGELVADVDTGVTYKQRYPQVYPLKARSIKPFSHTAQAAAALSHHGPVAETFIADRVPYAAAMTDGRTAIELTSKGPAALETAALWKNIKACLHANMKKQEKVRRHG